MHQQQLKQNQVNLLGKIKMLGEGKMGYGVILLNLKLRLNIKIFWVGF
jgi:hypothetical protein